MKWSPYSQKTQWDYSHGVLLPTEQPARFRWQLRQFFRGKPLGIR